MVPRQVGRFVPLLLGTNLPTARQLPAFLLTKGTTLMYEHADEFPAPTLAGDPHDDDGRVIDSLVEQRAEPPRPDQEPREDWTPVPTPARNLTGSRLVTGSQIFYDATIETLPPMLVLPADPNRIYLSMGLTRGYVELYYADSPSKLQLVTPSSDGSYRTYQSAASLFTGVMNELHGYTGPIYVAGFAGGVTPRSALSWTAVTK